MGTGLGVGQVDVLVLGGYEDRDRGYGPLWQGGWQGRLLDTSGFGASELTNTKSNAM